jgi:hypothetical protein
MWTYFQLCLLQEENALRHPGSRITDTSLRGSILEHFIMVSASSVEAPTLCLWIASVVRLLRRIYSLGKLISTLRSTPHYIPQHIAPLHHLRTSNFGPPVFSRPPVLLRHMFRSSPQ